MHSIDSSPPNLAVRTVERWLEATVIGLNLCPFAQREWLRQAVRVVSTPATTEVALLHALHTELNLLCEDSSVETTLLVHPKVLTDFLDYNDFLGIAEDMLTSLDLDGVIQIASFHPHYQFGGTSPADAENYTNRSPYPLLHLLREDSVARAVSAHPDAAGIPARNIELMNRLGATAMQKMLDDTLA